MLQTLSPARIRNDCITWSAVSASVDSLVMKSRNASNVTDPWPFGSTSDIIRWKSASPYIKQINTFKHILNDNINSFQSPFTIGTISMHQSGLKVGWGHGSRFENWEWRASWKFNRWRHIAQDWGYNPWNFYLITHKSFSISEKLPLWKVFHLIFLYCTL